MTLDTKALEAVKVKPLAWVVMDDAGERSITICGMYAISPKGEKLTLTGMPGRGLGRFESMEDAKAAAQKDYAIRILSAIDLSATPSRNDILEALSDLADCAAPFGIGNLGYDGNSEAKLTASILRARALLRALVKPAAAPSQTPATDAEVRDGVRGLLRE